MERESIAVGVLELCLLALVNDSPRRRYIILYSNFQLHWVCDSGLQRLRGIDLPWAPSLDADLAWDRLIKGEYLYPVSTTCRSVTTNITRLSRPFLLDAEFLLRIDAPLNSTRLTKEAGGGYIANIAVFHQLHCLVGSSLSHISRQHCQRRPRKLYGSIHTWTTMKRSTLYFRSRRRNCIDTSVSNPAYLNALN